MHHVHRLLSLIMLTCALASDGLAQARPGSIYDPDLGPSSQIAARTAFRKGDILTVLIRESTSVRNEEASDLAKSTNLNYKINLFDISPTTFDVLPKLDADSNEGFIGSANYQKSGAFTARLAASRGRHHAQRQPGHQRPARDPRRQRDQADRVHRHRAALRHRSRQLD